MQLMRAALVILTDWKEIGKAGFKSALKMPLLFTEIACATLAVSSVYSHAPPGRLSTVGRGTTNPFPSACHMRGFQVCCLSRPGRLCV